MEPEFSLIFGYNSQLQSSMHINTFPTFQISVVCRLLSQTNSPFPATSSFSGNKNNRSLNET